MSRLHISGVVVDVVDCPNWSFPTLLSISSIVEIGHFRFAAIIVGRLNCSFPSLLWIWWVAKFSLSRSAFSIHVRLGCFILHANSGHLLSAESFIVMYLNLVRTIHSELFLSAGITKCLFLVPNDVTLYGFHRGSSSSRGPQIRSFSTWSDMICFSCTLSESSTKIPATAPCVYGLTRPLWTAQIFVLCDHLLKSSRILLHTVPRCVVLSCLA